VRPNAGGKAARVPRVAIVLIQFLSFWDTFGIHVAGDDINRRAVVANQRPAPGVASLNQCFVFRKTQRRRSQLRLPATHGSVIMPDTLPNAPESNLNEAEFPGAEL
jgi:hypothetical protein